MELIAKEALLEKIDGEIKLLEPYLGACAGQIVAEANSKNAAYNRVKDILNTLEVKEVDLEKYYHDFLQKEWFGNSHVRTISEMMAFTAKHFFELGLQSAQKGE